MRRRSSSRPVSAPPHTRVAASPRRRWDLARWTIIGLALAVRIAVVLQLSHHPLLEPRGVLDDAVYARLAGRVASGDLLLGPEPYFLAPLYTYVLGAVFALTGGSLTAARLVQAVLGSAAVGFVMATATRWFGRRAGLIAGALAAVTGVFAFNETLILQSSIDPFVTSVALYLLARAARSDAWTRAAAAGAGLGLLALNRPNALLVIAAVATACAALPFSRLNVRRAAALLLGAAIVITPVTIRNRVVSGEWVAITSHGGLNFYIGNSPGADGTWHAVDGVRPSIDGQVEDVKAVAARALGRPATATDASAYFYGLAFAWIGGHPLDWLALSARKALLTLSATDIGLNYSYTYFARDESGVLSALAVGPWLLIPLGMLGLVLAAPPDDRRRFTVWAIAVPAYAMSVAAFFVSSRYRLPLLVPMAVAAGGAVDALWRRWPAWSRRTQGLAAASAAGLFVLVAWPLVPDNGRQFQRGDRVLQLISDGAVDEGLALLAKTTPAHPDPGLLLYRVGLAFRERGEPARAVAYLREAKSHAPDERHIDLNLGEALLEAGRPGEAIPYLEAARAARVDLPVVTYDLVGAYHAVGRITDARVALASIQVTHETDGRALVEYGAAALELEDPALAERFLAVALGRPESAATAYPKLAAALGMQGRDKEAFAVLAQGASRFPQDPEIRQLLDAVAAGGRKRP